MRIKGFTLIELLAVIVILAIIALIAVPIIINIIGDTKKQGNERSIDMYGKAVEQAIAKSQLNGAEISIGDLNSDFLKTVEYEGNTVECETNKLYKDGKIYLSGCKVNGNLIEYSYGKRQIIKSKLIKGSEFRDKINTLIIENNVTSDLGILVIYFTSETKCPTSDILADMSDVQDGSIMAFAYSGSGNVARVNVCSENLITLNEDSSYMFNFYNLEDYRYESIIYGYDNILVSFNTEIDTSKVTDMSHIFENYYNTYELDLSSFDTSSVINTEDMFKGATDLKTIYVSDKWTLGTELLTDTTANEYTIKTES